MSRVLLAVRTDRVAGLRLQIGATRGRMLEIAILIAEIEITIVHVAANEDVIMTERVDDFLVGGRRIPLPVMGACEVRDGKIAAWRDYFDREQLFSQVRAEG